MRSPGMVSFSESLQPNAALASLSAHTPEYKKPLKSSLFFLLTSPQAPTCLALETLLLLPSIFPCLHMHQYTLHMPTLHQTTISFWFHSDRGVCSASFKQSPLMALNGSKSTLMPLSSFAISLPCPQTTSSTQSNDTQWDQPPHLTSLLQHTPSTSVHGTAVLP